MKGVMSDLIELHYLQMQLSKFWILKKIYVNSANKQNRSGKVVPDGLFIKFMVKTSLEKFLFHINQESAIEGHKLRALRFLGSRMR